MKFKSGDLVRVVNCPWWPHHGKVTRTLRPATCHINYNGDVGPGWYLDLTPTPPCVSVKCPEIHLEPIGYDGNQKTSWEDMKDIWQPKELVRVSPKAPEYETSSGA